MLLEGTVEFVGATRVLANNKIDKQNRDNIKAIDDDFIRTKADVLTWVNWNY